jgi:hypothetical protein
MAKQNFLTAVENNTFLAKLKATGDWDEAVASVPKVDPEHLAAHREIFYAAAGVELPKPTEPAKPAAPTKAEVKPEPTKKTDPLT